MVSPTEPEAILQKVKRGRGYAPGYTPSVLANEKRVVLGHDVDPISEITVIPGMLDQASRISGANLEELLFDGGYFNRTRRPTEFCNYESGTCHRHETFTVFL
ncbi:MAG: hypothetical protein ACR2PT_18130 [Endozoicomonas sp.]